MRISEITLDVLKNYIHVYHDEDDTLLEAILSGATSYIQGYTGLSSDTLDLYDEITIALFVICTELYDNRSYTMNHHQVNPVVKTILGMHAINNL